jgi:hypothetical protein
MSTLQIEFTKRAYLTNYVLSSATESLVPSSSFVKLNSRFASGSDSWINWILTRRPNDLLWLESRDMKPLRESQPPISGPTSLLHTFMQIILSNCFGTNRRIRPPYIFYFLLPLLLYPNQLSSS